MALTKNVLRFSSSLAMVRRATTYLSFGAASSLDNTLSKSTCSSLSPFAAKAEGRKRYREKGREGGERGEEREKGRERRGGGQRGWKGREGKRDACMLAKPTHTHTTTQTHARTTTQTNWRAALLLGTKSKGSHDNGLAEKLSNARVCNTLSALFTRRRKKSKGEGKLVKDEEKMLSFHKMKRSSSSSSRTVQKYTKPSVFLCVFFSFCIPLSTLKRDEQPTTRHDKQTHNRVEGLALRVGEEWGENKTCEMDVCV